MFRQIFALFSLILVAQAASRIVGGNLASSGQVPFQVSLRAHGTSFHFAGGVLINNRWLLTVAHKVAGRANNSISIILGIIFLTDGGTSRRSDTIVLHPNFDFATMANDLACVRSGTNINFGQTIQSIFILPNFVEEGFTSQVSGWGAIESDKGENANQLRVLNVVTDDQEKCKDRHGFRVTDGHICATGILPGTGICTTDVGGPLIMNSQLIGIPSWFDVPCGTSPDLYIRISHYRDWIRTVTGV